MKFTDGGDLDGPGPFRPKKRGTERPLQKPTALLVLVFVEAARFWGGPLLAPWRTNLSHSLTDGDLFFFPAICNNS